MFKRILAIAAIFVCSSLAWMILASSIWRRTNDSGAKLRPGVASTWGAPQEQIQPVTVLEGAGGGHLNAERTRVKAELALEYRQKGLLWYSTYVVKFAGTYTFRNAGDQTAQMKFTLPFPAQQAIYDDLTISANGAALPFSSDPSGATVAATAPAGQATEFLVTYTSHGLDAWRYNFGNDAKQMRDFELILITNFRDIDFPNDTLSPNDKIESAQGWELGWRYRSLISGSAIGMTMPEKLQPGPIAGEISEFAPVSLLLFFFVMTILTTARKVELHPMNYFFLAAAFFSFHLLLAYSVDHLSIEWAFAVSSLVSVGLVVSYLRAVVGARFAIVEAGLAQFVYLVLFSFTFFLQGFTGLAITIGCIVTEHTQAIVCGDAGNGAGTDWLGERLGAEGSAWRRSDASWLG